MRPGSQDQWQVIERARGEPAVTLAPVAVPPVPATASSVRLAASAPESCSIHRPTRGRGKSSSAPAPRATRVHGAGRCGRWRGVGAGVVWALAWCGRWRGVGAGVVWALAWCGRWRGVGAGVVWALAWCGRWRGVGAGVVWALAWCGRWRGVGAGVVWALAWCGRWRGVGAGVVWALAWCGRWRGVGAGVVRDARAGSRRQCRRADVGAGVVGGRCAGRMLSLSECGCGARGSAVPTPRAVRSTGRQGWKGAASPATPWPEAAGSVKRGKDAGQAVAECPGYRSDMTISHSAQGARLVCPPLTPILTVK